jgi:predicted RecB family nuclease
MSTRYDVSSVPLQGGYVAKQCPVRAQNDTLQPGVPIEVSAVLERRFARGRDFEAEVVAELLAAHPDAIVIEGGNAAATEAATVAAMQGGAPLILNSRLPSDPIGRRVGKPDLLVAAPGAGYRAVDVKHHGALTPATGRDGEIPASCAPLDRPWLEDAVPDPLVLLRKHKGDLLQLAHYQRMLETAGLASADGRYGGIIGAEGRVAWHDLDASIWRTPSSAGKTKLRSTMEVYDFEFAFRLDVISVAQQHLADPSVSPLLVPVRISECGECPWRDLCRSQLEAGSGDVSLIPRIGWRDWKMHREHGVTDRAELAALDPRTATIAAAGVDVADLIALVDGLPDATRLDDVDGMSGRPAQLATLAAAGVATVADASALSPATAAYGRVSSLPEQIDRARATLGPAPAYRRRGVEALSVPRGHVELDVDMENVEDGVYLWGALLSRHGSEPTYRAFVTWEPLTPEEQTRNFLELWDWLTELRASAAEAGETFRAYCYSESAENRFMRECGAAAGLLEDVEAFIASDEWVDMLEVFDTQLISGGPSGLKVVAPLAGFGWSVDDPGGADSMLRYDEAIGAATEEERARSRDWLLRYNQGDVEATLAIREWIDAEAQAIPPIESLDAMWKGTAGG